MAAAAKRPESPGHYCGFKAAGLILAYGRATMTTCDADAAQGAEGFGPTTITKSCSGASSTPEKFGFFSICLS